jgi:hypothetical protein
MNGAMKAELDEQKPESALPGSPSPLLAVLQIF